jgi:hypothetical protein
MGIANASVAVKIPAVNSHGAHTSGTTKEYVNMGKLARKIREAITTRNTFMMQPVFHTSGATE